MSPTLDPWIVGIASTLIVSIVTWAAGRVVKAVEETRDNSAAIRAHEILCEERVKRFEAAHTQLADATEERHAENRGQHVEIRAQLGTIASKVEVIAGEMQATSNTVAAILVRLK